jgi:GT2 family glycosyltransferase
MVNFICVSNDQQKVMSLERSIRSTFGNTRPWKLEVVDGGRHDIFGGYNAGAANCVGDILVFLHQDVLVLANSMAFERPLLMLENPGTGLIGVAGATRLNAAGTWWGDLPQAQMLSFCRGFVGCPGKNEFGMNFLAWPGPGSFGEALVVDGVFLMCHRRTFERLGGFDDKSFKGFHFYDVDISLRAHLAGLRNHVAPIALYHDSTGKYDDVWEGARQIFVRKHAGRLPCQLRLA